MDVVLSVVDVESAVVVVTSANVNILVDVDDVVDDGDVSVDASVSMMVNVVVTVVVLVVGGGVIAAIGAVGFAVVGRVVDVDVDVDVNWHADTFFVCSTHVQLASEIHVGHSRQFVSVLPCKPHSANTSPCASGGNVPANRLPASCSLESPVSVANEFGRLPVRSLYERTSVESAVMAPS